MVAENEGTVDTGASVPAGETTATPAVDRSTLSDNELLGIGSYEKEEPVEAANGVKVPEVVEAKPVTEEPQVPAAVQEDQPLPALLPEELKRVLAKEPAIRDFYFRERAYSEVFPTVAEAREMRSMFPTVEDAQIVMQQAGNLLEAERVYQERPEEFIASIASEDPDAFTRFASVLSEAVYKVNPALYRTYIAEPAIGSVFTRLTDGAVKSGDEELQAAMAVVTHRLGLIGDAQQEYDPRLQKLEQMEREAAQRAEQNRQETVQNFESSVQRAFFEGLETRVTDAIKRLNPAMSERAIARVHGEVIEGVTAKLTSNQWLSQQARALTGSGDYGQAHLGQVVSLLGKHAEPLIGPAVASVMNEWTNEIMRVNSAGRNETKRATGSKEVGAGNAPVRDGNGRFTKVAPSHELYEKFSDMDIIEGRHREA